MFPILFGLFVSRVGGLRLLVDGRTLPHQPEALDVECQTCGHDGCNPRMFLAVRGTFLRDELAPLVLDKHDRRLLRVRGLHGWHGYNVGQGEIAWASSELTILSLVPSI